MMTNEQQIRAMLAPADPASATAIPPAAATAAQLIARAETAAARTPRTALPRRRLVLAGGTALVATAVTAYVLPKHVTTGGNATPPPDTPPIGRVLVPIAYQFDTDLQPAAPRLRDLAARITDTGYETRTGRYAYRQGKSWSSTRLGSEDGYSVGFVEGEQMWTAPDGSGRVRTKVLGVEFPNEESRRYWEPRLPGYGFPEESVQDTPASGAGDPSPTGSPTSQVHPDPAERVRPADPTRPPTSRADLAKLIRAEHGAEHAVKWTMELYRSYVVPRQVRAQVLLILAGLDGFVWRGAAVDRAGRRGVTISVTWAPPPDNVDRNRYESVLVFDPRTGELLATETTVLTPRRKPSNYHLILSPGWTDQLG